MPSPSANKIQPSPRELTPDLRAARHRWGTAAVVAGRIGKGGDELEEYPEGSSLDSPRAAPEQRRAGRERRNWRVTGQWVSLGLCVRPNKEISAHVPWFAVYAVGRCRASKYWICAQNFPEQSRNRKREYLIPTLHEMKHEQSSRLN